LETKFRLIVKGIVQGVIYRWFVKDQAKKLEVDGTVKNLPDGTVEIICKAPEERKTKRVYCCYI